MNLEVVVPNLQRGKSISIVGEAPGACECGKCSCYGGAHPVYEPFVGRAGQLLSRILNAGGLTRNDVNLLNVTQRPPDGGYDSEHFKTTFYQATGKSKKPTQPTSELLAWYERLAADLTAHRPNVVVACGAEALKALCGLNGISNYRGSLLESTLVPGLKVIPLLHPAAILRGAQWQEIYVSGRIMREKIALHAAFPDLCPQQDWWQQIDPQDMDEPLTFMEAIESSWCLDLEIRGGSVACVGLGHGDGAFDAAMVVPIQLTTGPRWQSSEEAAFWQGLQRLMDRNPLLLGSNIVSFDLYWLMKYGLEPSGVDDTMVMFGRLYPELPKGLDFRTMLYTYIPYYKLDGKTWRSNFPNEQLHTYNAKDVIADLRSFRGMMREMQQRPQVMEKYQEAKKLFGPILEMQFMGLVSDEVERAEHRNILAPELEAKRQELAKLTNGELAVRPGNKTITPRQKQHYLYKTLGLTPKKKRAKKGKGGNVTADEDALVELMVEYPQHEVLKVMIREAHLFKSLNDYVDVKLEDIAL